MLTSIFLSNQGSQLPSGVGSSLELIVSHRQKKSITNKKTMAE
jgi:hypothetical protein